MAQLSSVVQADEPLARYIFYSNHFSRTGPKRQAFAPYKNEVSVMRHQNCCLDELIKIGNTVGGRRGRPVKAIASIVTRDVRAVDELDVVPDTRRGQHYRHANIVKFRQEVAQQKQQASRLAEKASLIYRSRRDGLNGRANSC